jgi:carbonic anhydrase/acetyltransferase-like protein (isoleucine patch superfamily)
MGINSSRNMFSLCSANYGIEKLIVMEKQGEKNMESKKSESDNQKIHIFLAPGAHVVGDVTLGDNVGIWYNAVVRGDTGSIFIDDNSNVQDNSTLHTDAGHSVHIGKGVSVGHNAVVHGCTIGDNTVVGMGSILLSGAVVGRNCIIGAGALVTGKMVIPDNSVAVGSPAKVIHQMTEDEIVENRKNAEHYIELMNAELQNL